MELIYFTSILKPNKTNIMKKSILFLIITLLSLFIMGCTNSNTDLYDIKELNKDKIEFLVNSVPFRNYAASRTDISEEMFIQWWKDQSDMYTTKWNKIYFYEYEIKWVDIKTFIPLLDVYSLDKNNIYIWQNILDIAPEDFNFISWALDYITDWTDIYYGDKKVQWANLDWYVIWWPSKWLLVCKRQK